MAAFITLFGFVIILVFTLQRIAVPRNFAAAAVMGSLGLWSVVGACAKWLTGSVLPSASAVQAALAEAWESSIGATVIVAVGLTVLGAAHYLDADPSRWLSA